MRFRLNEFEKVYPHILGRMLEFITKSYFEAAGYPEVRMHFDDRSVMKANKGIDVLGVDKDHRSVALVECSAGIPAGKTELAEFICEIKFKDQCLRESGKFDGFDIRKFVVTTRNQVARIRAFHAVKRRLSRIGASMLILEDDILPSLPPRFDQDRLLSRLYSMS